MTTDPARRVAIWTLASGAVVFVAVWTVMMAAMILPAAAPMIVIFASAQARRERDIAIPTWIFTAGYILVWLAAGLLVYILVQIGSEIVTGLTSADRASWGPVALGTTLVAAGLYQFTPIKRVCLTHCRSPFAFVAQHWRDGRAGSSREGPQFPGGIGPEPGDSAALTDHVGGQRVGAGAPGPCAASVARGRGSGGSVSARNARVGRRGCGTSSGHTG